MNNNIFDFLNFDFSDLAKKLEDLKVLANDRYNDFINNNVKKYDLNTEEGYEAFIKEAAEIRTQLIKSDSVFADKLVTLLDSMVEKAMKNHSENTHLPKTDKVNELVGKEVNRVKEENHGRLNEGECMKEVEEDTVDWPSNKLTPKQKRNIWKLVDEYMDTMVIPYLDDDFDEDLVADMSGGLFEFAAWILTKEED